MDYNCIEIDSYEKLLDFEKSCKNDKDSKWIFRGDKCNGLRTTLEKAFDSIDRTVINEKDLDTHKINAEKDIIREFQRKLHLYTNNLPTRTDILQWLALMQHHKAPTRLLDWTYSFWVAIHFATTRRKFNEKAVIWAVNAEKILKNMCNFFNKKIFNKYMKTYFVKDDSYCDLDSIRDNAAISFLINEQPQSMVYWTDPYRMNERLTLQQGVFLIPGDVRISFKKNLIINESHDNKNYIKKGVINLNSKFKYNLNIELRKMNINNAVLFPDLDGFSESLWTRVSLPMKDKVSIESKNLKLIP